MESGVVSKATYHSYVHYSGGWCAVSGALCFLVLGNILLVATNAWLAIWLRAADKNREVNKTKYILCYMYGTAKKKRPGYLVGNLVATNWPIEKALHAIGYNQIPTK